MRNDVLARKHHWIRASTRVVYTDPWICLQVDTVVRPDGKMGEYSVVRFKGGVGIVATDERQRICLVGQYRYAPGVYSWEIPKGAFNNFDSSDSPLDTAKRELLEETGFTARRWKALGSVHTLLGSTDDKVYLFHASGLKLARPEPEPTERITVKMVTLARFINMQKKRGVTDATSIAAVLLALKHRAICRSIIR